MTSNETANVTFWPPPAGGLAVQLAGSGSGTVTSSPAGIDCGSTCSQDFPVDNLVTLTATAAPGSEFTGWSGPCTGTVTGACTVQPLLIGTVTVTATFDKAPPPPPPPAPRCTLRATGAKVTPKGAKAEALTLKVACNQAVSFSLTGKVTIKTKTEHKTKTSQLSLKAKHGNDKAGTTLSVSMKLPKAALSKLKKHAAESVAFRLTAKNANGSRTATATIKHLRG